MARRSEDWNEGLADDSSSNVLRAIHPKHSPTQETLEKLLEPLGLRIGLAKAKSGKRKRAA
jgi:hypothetical protein